MIPTTRFRPSSMTGNRTLFVFCSPLCSVEFCPSELGTHEAADLLAQHLPRTGKLLESFGVLTGIAFVCAASSLRLCRFLICVVSQWANVSQDGRAL
jgi:hypothetical protein